VRPSRALPYELHVTSQITPDTTRLGATQVELSFANTGGVAAVFHVYDRLHLDRLPRRYTVEPKKALKDTWQPVGGGAYDLWVMGPNGFHRHFTGNARRVAAVAQPNPDVRLEYDVPGGSLIVTLTNTGPVPCLFSLVPNAYFASSAGATQTVIARSEFKLSRSLASSALWYDFSVKVHGQPDYSRRFAGRMETGLPSLSDPAMGGTALAEQLRVS
jgi:phospholipase C